MTLESIVALLLINTVCLFICCRACTQAGLLGCEAVLSSMALMQAGSMPNHRKMSSHLGHGQRENNHSHNHNNNHNHNQDTQNQNGHMVLPSGISCPPLVRRKKTLFMCSHSVPFSTVHTWFISGIWKRITKRWVWSELRPCQVVVWMQCPLLRFGVWILYLVHFWFVWVFSF